MRALVTGASGLVGGHLVEALQREGADVLACSGPGELSESFFPLDLAEPASIRAALDVARPTVIFHLAAQTFVPDSFASPLRTYDVNAIGCARLTQAIREYVAGGGEMPRILFTSSAEVYGKRDPADYPLRENLDVRPATPYAASKAAAEAMLLGEARSLGMDVVVARSFNHIGPGQSDRFVVPSFAAQLARIAAGQPPLLEVGNLEAARDFLDVRDVVAAYLALARDGERGEVYNVCSGVAVKIRDVLRMLITIANVPVEVRDDPARMRPVDVPVFVGNAGKLAARTGWSRTISLDRSLRDIYASARDALQRAGNAGSVS
ncbi:MAG: GDP-mannose 4,6-dehydratase [Candidatus Eremiobacteraeota bacterium]|nr:GDP-mannose 4,6-dehydratase [Candidatus Eremiobacteraeota bacterium]